MQKLFMFLLAAVSAVVQFGKNGGFVKWVTDHFEALDPDETTPARIKAAAAVDADDVVVLSQLNNSLIEKVNGGLVVKAVTNSFPTAAEGNRGWVYINSDNTTELEFLMSDGSAWIELTLSEGQLVIFEDDATLPGSWADIGVGGTQSDVYENHLYIYESPTKLFDNGSSSVDDTDVVKTAHTTITSAGLTSFTFSPDIPSDCFITEITVAVSIAFNDEFTNISIVDGSEVLLNAHDVAMKKVGLYKKELAYVKSSNLEVNFNGGTITAGQATLLVTYIKTNV